MALQVKFALSSELLEALRSLQATDELRAVIASIEQENVRLVRALPSTQDVSADFTNIREQCHTLEAAFVVLKRDAKLTMITYAPETLKPRTKMMYAASSSYLRSEAKIFGDTHLCNVADITPEMFGIGANDRDTLRTEKEKDQQKIEEAQHHELQQAPARVTAMHGVAASISNAVIEDLQLVGNTKIACIFSVMGQEARIDQMFDREAQPEEVFALAPADVPCFVLMEWSEKRLIFIYICPEVCKPKIRMQFAAAKSSIVSQMKAAGIAITRSIEVSSIADIKERIESALVELPLDETPATPPAKRTMMKGPRMFMPE